MIKINIEDAIPATEYKEEARNIPAVMAFIEDDDIIYIGHTTRLSGRLGDHLVGDASGSALQRNVGGMKFGFTLQDRKGRKRFTDAQEAEIKDYLRSLRVWAIEVEDPVKAKKELISAYETQHGQLPRYNINR